MNMKSYLFSMLALSALISCSKKLDEPQAPTQKVDADAAYMSVTIEAPEAGASTYAHEPVVFPLRHFCQKRKKNARRYWRN